MQNRYLILFFLVCALGALGSLWSQNSRNIWLKQVELIEKEMAKEPPDSIMFLGSSTIKRWESLKMDMQPLHVHNAGFGGAMISDIAFFIDRLLKEKTPKAVVIYAGDNDISSSKFRHSPEEVFNKLIHLSNKIREIAVNNGAKTPPEVYFVSIKPSPSRFALWSKMKLANSFLQYHCDITEGCTYIDTASSMFDSSGNPLDTLFLKDRLHLNSQGYKLWANIIKTILLNKEKTNLE